MNNLLTTIPDEVEQELFDELIHSDNVRIERIVSKGQSSPESGWYDQDEQEWVVVLQGGGVIQFEDGDEVKLSSGDYINIPAHRRHRVAWTAPDCVTIWLAVFY
ncbi:MAG: cupin domain-containing protein [Gammaproteobacteria bacterium]|jgi:cupin 2 domain-containing protein|nr:cupin domain-containing protein [Gammaproteobacteria bacterium]MBT4605391.1 cupin domain-containing protein [Thiotrichales bacterium]MBT7684812.1 cupin domain-containing protein [Candidatus Neomarinimicrobiota bacterium]MBT5372980.1 cupin domain-containing protein [Gammaproteobacteria bacterium]MBT5747074.1 cupin domain-containing protein [Gammaproteobacteria bacterium]